MIIDQTELPQRLVYLSLSSAKDVVEAIKKMKIRGAPALAGAAAFGLYLGIKDSKAEVYNIFKEEIDSTAEIIRKSRPTAVNLFWGLERMVKKAEANKQKSILEIKRILLKEAKDILEQDRLVCRKLAEIGSQLIKDNERILTICNAGILATVDYGTALGVIYTAKKQGKRIKVYACETRPLLQGARLT
ncbi:MAG: S-methyl-5-thioribose-1-phosphate isomerase, partial [Candidatus Omnitrophica bacterium]|nr:S-methyl-5-thioribose-1-phosphate isomerase [Candidatus Omnitrophota bacterium]